MSARTTAAQVAAILGPHYDSAGTLSLQPHLDTAVILTDWLVSQDSDGELGTAALERIEAYLGAHFYALADQIAQSRNTGRASATFMGQTGLYLDGTQYGQTAKLLDVTGNLAEREKQMAGGGRITAGVTWLGRPPSEQTDYVDRD